MSDEMPEIINQTLATALWAEANLLDEMADLVQRERLGPDDTADYLRDSAITIRKASSNAVAGRELAA